MPEVISSLLDWLDRKEKEADRPVPPPTPKNYWPGPPVPDTSKPRVQPKAQPQPSGPIPRPTQRVVQPTEPEAQPVQQQVRPQDSPYYAQTVEDQEERRPVYEGPSRTHIEPQKSKSYSDVDNQDRWQSPKWWSWMQENVVEPLAPLIQPIERATNLTDYIMQSPELGVLTEWYNRQPRTRLMREDLEARRQKDLEEQRRYGVGEAIVGALKPGVQGIGGVQLPGILPAAANVAAGSLMAAADAAPWTKPLRWGGERAINEVFDIASITPATTPVDELGQVLMRQPPAKRGTAPSLAQVTAPAGAVASRSIFGAIPILAETFNIKPIPFEVPETDLFGPTKITNPFGPMWDAYREEYAGIEAVENRIRALPEPMRHEAELVLGLQFSGMKAMEKAEDQIVHRQEILAEKREQRDQAIVRGDIETSSRLGQEIYDLENKTAAEIVMQNMVVPAEIVSGILVDWTNLIGPGLKLIGLTQEAYRLEKAAKLLNLPEGKAVDNIMDAAQRLEPVIKAMTAGEDANAFWARVFAAKKLEGWGAALREGTWLTARTAESLADLDTNTLWKAATNLLNGYLDKEEIKLILRAWSHPESRADMVRGFNLNGKAYKWGAGVIGNERVVKTYPALDAMADTLQNMRSLKGEGNINPYDFLAELAGILYDGTRRMHGIGGVKTLPFGAKDVQVRSLPNGQAILAYVNKKGETLQRSVEMPLAEANRRLKAIKGVKTTSGGEMMYDLAKLPADIQRAIMGDMWLALRPANWIRNATSATAMLLSQDAYTFTRTKDIVDDLALKFAGGGPTMRMEDIRTGAQGLAGREVGSGAIAKVSRVALGKDNPISRFMAKVYNIPYGSTEIPLGGLAIPVGEQAFYSRAFYVPFQRTLRRVWKRWVYAELGPKLDNLGVAPELRKTILDNVVNSGVKGNRWSIKQTAKDLTTRDRMIDSLASLEIPDELVDLETWNAIERVIHNATPDQAEDVIRNVRQAFRTMTERAAEILRSNPPQANPDWTQVQVNVDVADIIDDMTDAGVRAGMGAQEATQRATEVATRWANSQQGAWDAFMQELTQSQTLDGVWDVAVDFWQDMVSIRKIARSDVDEASRTAIRLNSAEGWQAKWEANERIWGRYAGEFDRVAERYKEILGGLKQGGRYVAKHPWWETVKRYVDWDEAELERALGMTFTKPSAAEAERFQSMIDAYRDYSDHLMALMVESFKRYPSTDHYDIMVDTLRTADHMGAQVAAFLAEKRATLLPNQAKQYYALKNKAWKSYWGEMLPEYIKAQARNIIQAGLEGESQDILRWTDDITGHEMRLLEPLGDGSYMAEDVVTGDVFRLGGEGGLPIPDDVRTRLGEAATQHDAQVAAVMEQVQDQVSGTIPVSSPDINSAVVNAINSHRVVTDQPVDNQDFWKGVEQGLRRYGWEIDWTSLRHSDEFGINSVNIKRRTPAPFATGGTSTPAPTVPQPPQPAPSARRYFTVGQVVDTPDGTGSVVNFRSGNKITVSITVDRPGMPPKIVKRTYDAGHIRPRGPQAIAPEAPQAPAAAPAAAPTPAAPKVPVPHITDVPGATPAGNKIEYALTDDGKVIDLEFYNVTNGQATVEVRPTPKGYQASYREGAGTQPITSGPNLTQKQAIAWADNLLSQRFPHVTPPLLDETKLAATQAKQYVRRGASAEWIGTVRGHEGEGEYPVYMRILEGDPEDYEFGGTFIAQVLEDVPGGTPEEVEKWGNLIDAGDIVDFGPNYTIEKLRRFTEEDRMRMVREPGLFGGQPKRIITDNELRRAASEAGIGTVTEKGVPYDTHLLNAVNKDLGTKYKSLKQIEDDYRERVFDYLKNRAAERAAVHDPTLTRIEPVASALPVQPETVDNLPFKDIWINRDHPLHNALVDAVEEEIQSLAKTKNVGEGIAYANLRSKILDDLYDGKQVRMWKRIQKKLQAEAVQRSETDEAVSRLDELLQIIAKADRDAPDTVKAKQELASMVLPGIRMAEAEETADLYAMLMRGEITNDAWQGYVHRCIAEKRIAGVTDEQVAASRVALGEPLRAKAVAKTAPEVEPKLFSLSQYVDRRANEIYYPKVEKTGAGWYVGYPDGFDTKLPRRSFSKKLEAVEYQNEIVQEQFDRITRDWLKQVDAAWERGETLSPEVLDSLREYDEGLHLKYSKPKGAAETAQTAAETAQAATEAAPELAKSKGHEMFVGDYEYYTRDGELWKAPTSNVIDLDTGQRAGRFELPAHMREKGLDNLRTHGTTYVPIEKQDFVPEKGGIVEEYLQRPNSAGAWERHVKLAENAAEDSQRFKKIPWEVNEAQRAVDDALKAVDKTDRDLSFWRQGKTGFVYASQEEAEQALEAARATLAEKEAALGRLQAQIPPTAEELWLEYVTYRANNFDKGIDDTARALAERYLIAARKRHLDVHKALYFDQPDLRFVAPELLQPTKVFHAPDHLKKPKGKPAASGLTAAQKDWLVQTIDKDVRDWAIAEGKGGSRVLVEVPGIGYVSITDLSKRTLDGLIDIVTGPGYTGAMPNFPMTTPKADWVSFAQDMSPEARRLYTAMLQDWEKKDKSVRHVFDSTGEESVFEELANLGLVEPTHVGSKDFRLVDRWAPEEIDFPVDAMEEVRNMRPFSKISRRETEAWTGNRAPKGSPYWSDGHSIIRKDAVKTGGFKKMYDKVPKEKNPRELSPNTIQAVWDEQVKQANKPLIELGYQPRQIKGGHMDMVYLLDADNNVYFANMQMYRAAKEATDPDAIMGYDVEKAIVFYKDGKPVAVLGGIQNAQRAPDLGQHLAIYANQHGLDATTGLGGKFYSGIPVPDVYELLGLNRADGPLHKQLLGAMRRSRARGGAQAPEVGDLAAHTISTLEEAEEAIVRAIPHLLRGQPNTLTPAQRRRIAEIVEGMMARYDDALGIAVEVGEKTADWAMLNFNDRRHFDQILALVYPYHYFWSRMPSRMLMTALTKPSFVNLYYEGKQAIARENRQQDMPLRLEGTTPLPGVKLLGQDVRIGMENWLDNAIPFGMYIQPSPFVEPSDAVNDVDKWVRRIEQWTPGTFPLNQMLLDWLRGGTEQRNLGDFLPIPRMVGYANMARTGQIGGPSILRLGDEYDYGRAGRELTVIAREQGISPQLAQWAMDIGWQILQTTGPLPEQPEKAQKLWEQGVRRMGINRGVALLGSWLLGVGIYPYPEGEKELRKAQKTRRGLGYSAESNIGGSKAAVEAFDEEMGGYMEPWFNYPNMYPQTGERTYTGETRPGILAARNELEAAKDKIYAQYTQNIEDWLAANPGANWKVFQAYKKEQQALRDEALQAAEAAWPSAKLGKKTDWSTVDVYKTMSPDELNEAAIENAIRMAQEQLASLKPGEGAKSAQWDSYNAAVAQLAHDLLMKLGSELVMGHELGGSQIEDAARRLGVDVSTVQRPPKPDEVNMADALDDYLNRYTPLAEQQFWDKWESVWEKGSEGRARENAIWAERKAQVRAQFGDDVGTLYEQYLSLAKGDARKKFKAENPILRAVSLFTWHPEQYGEIEELFGEGAIEEWAYMPAWNGTEKANKARSAYYDEHPRAFLVNAWLYGRPSKDESEVDDDGAFEYNFGADFEEAKTLFGVDIWNVVSGYKRAWDKKTKAAYYEAHPELSDFFDWWYGGMDQGTSTAYTSSYARYYGGYGGGGGGYSSWEKPSYIDRGTPRQAYMFGAQEMKLPMPYTRREPWRAPTTSSQWRSFREAVGPRS